MTVLSYVPLHPNVCAGAQSCIIHELLGLELCPKRREPAGRSEFINSEMPRRLTNTLFILARKQLFPRELLVLGHGASRGWPLAMPQQVALRAPIVLMAVVLWTERFTMQ